MTQSGGKHRETQREEAPGLEVVHGAPGEVPARRNHVWVRRIVVGLLGAAVLAVLVGGFAWQSTGGRWQVVATPSMGQVAPVGSLVFTRPVTADQLAVGDVITYRPPGSAQRETITHRVIAVAGTGAATTVRTQGDINGAPDPRDVGTADLVGRVTAIGWGLGWLVKALPLLVAGGVFVWFATRVWAPVLWRVPVRVLGFSLALSTATAVLKPFVGVISLGSTTDAAGTHVLVVSTGLLPIRVTAETGGSVDLVDGQVGMLTTQLSGDSKGAVLTSGVHMPIWLWVLMVLLWLTPLLYGLVAGRRDFALLQAADAAFRAEPEPDETPTLELPALAPVPVPGLRRRLRRPAAVGFVVALVVTAMVVSTAATQAAFTARVVNSANTAATAPYFTCLAADTAPTTASPSFVWPLDDTTVTSGSTARDVEGTRTGTYTNAFSGTTNRPCLRDTGTRAVTLAPTAANPSYIAPTATVASAGVNVFSQEVWFNTTTTSGGRLMGWGGSRTGQSSSYDRHLYMTNTGAVVFGVYPNAVKTVASATGLNDGQWHQAVATLSAAGMVLYVDGVAVATDTTTTTAETGTGFWRVGYDNLSGWTSRPTTDYWAGSMAWAAVYSGVALTATQVRTMYVAGV